MVRRPLKTDGVKEKKNDSSTQVEKGERRKILEFTKYFSVWRMHYVSSMYREDSQLIFEELWEQVIQILDLIQKYLKLSCKNILLSTKIDFIPKYNWLYTKIFQIVHQNISDCVPKYFSKTSGLRKHFLIMIKIIN
jgi:hypothetical protein